MQDHLLTVEDAFVAQGKGVLVMPRFTTQAPIRGAFEVELRLPDGSRTIVQASMDVAHLRGAQGSFAMYRLLGITPEEVPVGTEIWSVAPTV